MSVCNYLLKKSKVIESIKQTNLSEEKRKWFFIVNKENVNRASIYLDREIQALYQHIIPKELQYDNISILRRTNNRAQRTVGSYFKVLLSRANPQDEGFISLGMGSNLLTNPLPPRMRTAITQEVEDKTIENAANKGAPSSETVSNTSTNTTSAISTITQTDLEEQFNKLHQELRREQDKSIAKIKDKLQKDMQTALTKLLTKMHSNMLPSLQSSIEATFKAPMA
eukprot:9528767-Ditylum_brightwellii.AAC.1